MRSYHFVRAFAAVLTVIIAGPTGQGEPIAYRINDLNLRDPHAYMDLLGCRDFTDVELAGFSVNGEFEATMTQDGDGDGFLDTSLVLVLRPAGAADDCGQFNFMYAQCTAPVESTTCRMVAGGIASSQAVYADQLTDSCLSPLAGTVRPYNPAITSPTADCFTSDTISFWLFLGGEIPLSLQSVEVAATYPSDPATQLTNGLIRGFLSEADANNTIIPASFPLTGGKPLSVMLPGGDPPGSDQNCAAHSDKDVGPDGTTPGWWFYFNFTAEPVAFECLHMPDFDLNCQIDAADWGEMLACSSALIDGDKICECSHTNWDDDATVYLLEYAAFQNCYTEGPYDSAPSCVMVP